MTVERDDDLEIVSKATGHFPVMTSREPREGGGVSQSSTAFFKAREQALRFLTYRARSEAEVRRRLSRKHPAGVVEAVVESLRRQGLVDDLAFSRQWRSDRERWRPRSGRLIRQELLRFGVEAEVIDQCLEDFDEDLNARQAAAAMGRRLSSRQVDKEQFIEKLASHLRRRGFTSRLALETGGRTWEELGTDPLHRQADADEHQEQIPQAVHERTENEGDQEGEDDRGAGAQGQ